MSSAFSNSRKIINLLENIADPGTFRVVNTKGKRKVVGHYNGTKKTLTLPSRTSYDDGKIGLQRKYISSIIDCLDDDRRVSIPKFY